MTDSATFTLEPLDAIEITMLVDNSVDHLLGGREGVRRMTLSGLPGGPRVDTPLLDDATMPRSLLAEHGFSALVRVTRGGHSHTLLFDAGLSPGALPHNMDVLETPFGEVEAIVMSHGHIDHIGGLHGLARRHGRARMPMLLHPDFWLRRRIAPPDRTPVDIPPPSRSALEGAGFAVVEDRGPSLLLDGSVLITGEVARTVEYERGFPVHQALRDGVWTPDPLILDDQALIASVRGSGLIVLTGCGHAGVVNTVRHAQALTGETRVAAVVGGFHLSGPLFAPVIAPTVEALAALKPAMLIPAHCTGPAAQHALAGALPDAYVASSVGSRYTISAPA